MTDRLRETWLHAGAVFAPGGRSPRHFGDPVAELRAVLQHCALADGSDLTRLVATGPDYLGLLQRLSTGDVASLEPGGGRPTVLTSSKGRIVERLFVHRRGEREVLTVAGTAAGPRVLKHLSRFTFAEKTGLTDATDDTFQFLVVGPRASAALERVGLGRPDPFSLVTGRLDGTRVEVLGHDGLSAEGLSIVGPVGAAPGVWTTLASGIADAGGRTAGSEPLEARRVLRGLPAAGRELTEDRNPLEAGLWDAVSFDKGCYVGQEVVARLRTYDKVSRSLVGLRLPAGTAPPRAGAPLFDGDWKTGEVTSATLPPGHRAPVALAYVRRKVLRPDLELRLGDEAPGIPVRVTDLPFSDRV
jgi:hypothetical protein